MHEAKLVWPPVQAQALAEVDWKADLQRARHHKHKKKNTGAIGRGESPVDLSTINSLHTPHCKCFSTFAPLATSAKLDSGDKVG